MKHTFAILGLSILFMISQPLAICAQTQNAASAQHSATTLKHSPTADKYLAALDSLRKAYLDWKYEGGDTLSNPYLFQLLSSPTYYSSAAQQNFSLPAKTEGALSGNVEARTQRINEMLANVYATQPWLVERMEAPSSPSLTTAETEEAPSATPEEVPNSVDASAPDGGGEVQQGATFLGDMDAFHIKVKRPNFWKVKGGFNVQLQQTYISDNWYQGGDDSFSANGQFTLEANYNNKQKLTWDNKLEARLGFQTMDRYSLTGKFKPTTDLLRLTSKLGVKAFSHWYYTLAFQSWTQMTRAYEYYNDGNGVQQSRVTSDFMSPFEAVLSLGMEYKLEKPRFTLGANIAPVAVNYKHVSRSIYKDAQTLYQKFGLEHHDRFDFGSNLTVNAKWAICKQLTWQGRLYFFTSYHRTTAEFENTFSLKVNKYLSTILFLYPRFDDGVKRGEDHGYFQFKEYLSFGLDVSF